MKQTKTIVSLLAAVLCGLTALAQPQGEFPDNRVKVIVDNDLCGDPDGLFALAHQVLCKTVNIRGIVGAHLTAGERTWSEGTGTQADISAQRAEEVLDILGLKGAIPVVPGAPAKMTDPLKPVDSEGARLIISEALECTPERPLYLLFGGPLTDAASALLLEPKIAPNVILVWIGGQEYDFGHQKPWCGISDVEYNLNLSIAAAQTVFNESDVRLWQVPRDAYRRCLYSFSAMDAFVKPCGAMGEYLSESLARFRQFMQREAYVLGDSPLVLLSSLQSTFESDASSSDFVETEAPHITDDGLYEFTGEGRKIRVFTYIDTYLMFHDMEAKLSLAAE